MWLEHLEEHYAVVASHYDGRNNAVLSTRISKLNFQRLVERYRGGTPVTSTYTYTKHLVALLLTRCLQDWGSSQIERSDYLPPGFSNLVPLGFKMDTQCDANQAISHGKCNYDRIFGTLGYDTLHWPTSLFPETNRSLSVTALDTRPEAAFLYWLRDRDPGDLGPHVSVTSSSNCTTPQVDHQELGRTACTAEIPMVADKADQNACLSLAAVAKQRLSQWPDPPASAVCCIGDCDCNGEVMINELVASTNVALGLASVNSCLAVDYDVSDEVTISELIRAVSSKLAGCASSSLMAASASSAALELALGNSSQCRGAPTAVPVALTDGLGVAAGGQMDILFDTAALTFSHCTNQGLNDMEAHEVATSLPTTLPAPSGKTRLRVLIKPKNDVPISTFQNGLLAWCHFDVKSNTPVGDSHLLTERAFGGDAFGMDMLTTTSDGKVTITSSCGGGCS